MESSKKILLSTIGIAVLIVVVTGVTFAFFNYTRTGSRNVIKVGRIYFNTHQNGTINLSNLFPIDPEETGIMNDDTKVGTIEIEITGDTDYSEGIEYLVSSVDSNIYTSTGKIVPISLDIAVDSLGTPTANYFTVRENTNTSIYKKLVGDTLVGDQMLLVGYIVPNTTSGTIEGIDGSITIKAYLDKNNILISDTYDGTESDNMGTTNSMAQGKTVITTTEWNALQSTGVSFKVKVEANEGIWVTGSLEEIMRTKNYSTTLNRGIRDNESSEFVSAQSGINFGAISSDNNGKGIYMRAGTQNDDYPIVYYRGAVTDNNVIFANKCWKAVRTTDTGGVKLVYNGETGNVYGNGVNIELSSYANVNKVTDVADVSESFTFDSSDSTWNIELTGSSNTEFEFTVPSGNNYNLVMTGTSGSSCGGIMTFYKDGSTVTSATKGGGNAMNLTYSYGSLTSSNKIKMTYSGSSSATCPITFKIKMEQNSSALSNNQYTLVTNGISTSKKWTFDGNLKTWYTIVPNSSSTKITFGVVNDGNYAIKYTATSGPISIKKNGVILSSSAGTDKVIELGNITSSDVLSFEYQYMGPGSTRVEFSLLSQENIGLGCENSGNETQVTLNLGGIDTNTFSFSETSLYRSPAYNGYMYGTVYNYNWLNWTSGAKFGSSFTWDGTNYKLVDASETTPNATHHYSCNSTDANANCNELRYVHYWNGSSNLNSSAYYITLQNGENVDDALKKMQMNTNDSNIKDKIDIWYENSMTSYTNKLEDTIWCNDRSIGNYNNNGWIANGGDLSINLYYGAHERSNLASNTSMVKNQPSLVCTNKNDRFTVHNQNGNMALDYPAAMLTEDEIVLAGGVVNSNNSNTSFYLYTGNYYWTLSPSIFDGDGYASGFVVYGDGYFYPTSVDNSYGLRPSISIKPGLPVVKGTGIASDPYVIE